MPITEKDVRFWAASDSDFPQELKNIPEAPAALHVWGRMRPRDAFAVAVVGSRRPTPYGRAVAETLARDLAGAGITVVSGMARGIDTAAHAAALKAGGRTIAVLGGGLGRLYPPENKGLAEKISENGAVVSEYPFKTPPLPGHFPQRNRLISGLSLAVVVAEADEKSGALITARTAAEQGREVFAVPGSVFSPMSRGPHRLLKNGARVFHGIEDILEEVEAFKALLARKGPKPPPPASGAVSSVEGKILDALGLDPVPVDQVAIITGVPVPELCGTLLHLELKGLVRRLPGQSYAKTTMSEVARA